jgi:hypothetical protein
MRIWAMTESESTNSPQPRRVLPDELTACFRRLGLREGDNVVMHAALSSIGVLEGGAAVMLHRLTNVLGKEGTLLMPTFTSVTRHSTTHDNFTKHGCWCEIVATKAVLYRMKHLVITAERVLDDDPTALSCGRPECLSCSVGRNSWFGAQPTSIGANSIPPAILVRD